MIFTKVMLRELTPEQRQALEPAAVQTNVSLSTHRELTPEQRQALEQLAALRTAQARFVDRAQILLAITDGPQPSQVAQDLGVSRPTVYTWIHRFNDQGLHGLEDQPRAGRPPTYTAEQRAEVIATALTAPKDLGLPFSSWTLDHLQAYLHEQKQIPGQRSRIDEILLAEGLRWRHQETWFGARVDPAFAETRGSSRRSLPSRRRARSPSASTKWGHRRPEASPAKSPLAPNRSPRATAAAKPGEPSRRSTTAAAARDPSSAPCARPPVRRSPGPTAAGQRPTGPTSSRRSKRGFRRR